MAARAVRRVGAGRPGRTAVACLALLLAGAAAAPPEPDRGPTDLERLLQKRYLDRAVFLEADVKVRRLQSRKVVSSTWPRGADLSSVHPNTLVTDDGVFYTLDSEETREVATDVRPGVPIDPDNPGTQNDVLVRGGTIGDVVELQRDSVVVLPKGALARVIGVEEAPPDIRVTLEGVDGTAVSVLVRGAGDASVPAEERAGRFARLLGALARVIPADPQARLALIDPAWPAAVQETIRAGRVEPGMTPFQVLLAWGVPVHASQDGEGAEIWLYKRGSTILEQLRNAVNVYIARGRVVEVDSAATP